MEKRLRNMTSLSLVFVVVLMLVISPKTAAFTARPLRSSVPVHWASAARLPCPLCMAAEERKEEGVVELAVDDDDNEQKSSESSNKQAAPFLSQGELADDVLNPDLSDPKQTRVILYIIISLIPVLFLIPLMLGSRDLIPLDPVQV